MQTPSESELNDRFMSAVEETKTKMREYQAALGANLQSNVVDISRGAETPNEVAAREIAEDLLTIDALTNHTDENKAILEAIHSKYTTKLQSLQPNANGQIPALIGDREDNRSFVSRHKLKIMGFILVALITTTIALAPASFAFLAGALVVWPLINTIILPWITGTAVPAITSAYAASGIQAFAVNAGPMLLDKVVMPVASSGIGDAITTVGVLVEANPVPAGLATSGVLGAGAGLMKAGQSMREQLEALKAQESLDEEPAPGPNVPGNSSS